jgi:hypothetical protein
VSQPAKTYAPHGKFVQVMSVVYANPLALVPPVGTNPTPLSVTCLYAIDEDGRLWWHDATGWVEYPDPGGVRPPVSPKESK